GPCPRDALGRTAQGHRRARLPRPRGNARLPRGLRQRAPRGDRELLRAPRAAAGGERVLGRRV
ncbi:MAG: hypothetical protein AVDCRST_MAG55-645, partial [uncultured Rubrobacteraceae bacterium]